MTQLFFNSAREDVPADAILVSKSKVAAFYRHVVEQWEPLSEVLVFEMMTKMF